MDTRSQADALGSAAHRAIGAPPARVGPRMHLVSVYEFSLRAEVAPDVVVRAVADGTLLPAVERSGHMDIGHPAALAFLAARPFGEAGAPKIFGDGYLVPARGPAPEGAPAPVDIDHPIAWAYLARKWARVPTREDIDAFDGPKKLKRSSKRAKRRR